MINEQMRKEDEKLPLLERDSVDGLADSVRPNETMKPPLSAVLAVEAYRRVIFPLA